MTRGCNIPDCPDVHLCEQISRLYWGETLTLIEVAERLDLSWKVVWVRMTRHGIPRRPARPRNENPGRACSVPGCHRTAHARGWCNAHYQRWRTDGDPLAAGRTLDRWPANLLGQLEIVGSCVEFTGRRSVDGYGYLSKNGCNTPAHRGMWELMVGPIPDGLVIDHLCRNRGCVNPAHLEPVTPVENTRRGGNAIKTHCKRGHEFTPDNTRIETTGSRRCLSCARDRDRARRAA